MTYDYNDLQKQAASPGIGTVVYAAPLRWIQNLGTVPPGPHGPGESVIITSPHEMKEGKGFIQIYSTQEFSEFTGQSVGEPDSETMEWDLMLSNPGITPIQAEMIRHAKGEDWIFIIKDANCADGIPIQIGTDCARAKVRFELSSGQVNTGSKATKIMIKWYHPYPLFYAANIPLKPAVDEGGGEGE